MLHVNIFKKLLAEALSLWPDEYGGRTLIVACSEMLECEMVPQAAGPFSIRVIPIQI